jgi:hypothetical protein
VATWTTRERVFRTKEWVVPAAEPWGATHDQLLQCISLARSEVAARRRQDEGLQPDSETEVRMYDDDVRIHVRDDEVVVAVVLEDRVT